MMDPAIHLSTLIVVAWSFVTACISGWTVFSWIDDRIQHVRRERHRLEREAASESQPGAAA